MLFILLKISAHDKGKNYIIRELTKISIGNFIFDQACIKVKLSFESKNPNFTGHLIIFLAFSNSGNINHLRKVNEDKTSKNSDMMIHNQECQALLQKLDFSDKNV